ncbi:HpcH/HpaI aldolase/citrate lyase family protein [Streptomyces sp. H27-S2]|uniref:HpcH/HpaI aldolase/citrate lyase family protein n=1 Tax=Streptomyces antarcticus TaxID=2996458 RepID=UPI00227201B2|nr:CoA ester lyase [Streptomyces sp. H27-S2]MCY0949138.1 CoA ester lyase [Streptomyces sp. H27-S2]
MTASQLAPVPRSYLYVPGDRPEMLAKALGRGADALIVDLEDAVPASGKERARELVRSWLTGLDDHADVPRGTPEIWIRVNPGERGRAESALLAAPRVTGFCLAKCSDADIAAQHETLTAAEERHGLAPGTFALAPLLETASAVLDVRQIARAPRVRHLQLGEADLCAELGIEGPDVTDPDGAAAGAALVAIRMDLLLASAAAGLLPPVGPVSTDFTDLDALARTTRALRGLGYRSRACVHPRQLGTVHAAFTPGPEEVAAAQTLLDRFAEAVRDGSGVITGPDGRMVDEAVVRAARRVLATRR